MKSESSESALSSTGVGRLLWSRIIWRHWKGELRLTAVLVGILSLGVAVFLAVRLANKAAVTGFGLFTESIAGESDFILRPPAGSLDGKVLRQLRDELGSLPVGVFPVLEASGANADDPERGLLRLVGADLVALQNARNYTEGGSNFGSGAGRIGGEDESFLGRTDQGFVGDSFSQRFGTGEGDSFPLIVNDVRIDLSIAGVLPEDPNQPAVPDNLILMDLPALQELADAGGALSRIEFRIAPGGSQDSIRESTATALFRFSQASGLILETPEDRKSSVTQMSAAFRLNLTILSGLALLVGMYLIMQAMEAAVVKRRAEIAILRSLGVTPKQIRAAWLWEGIVLGLVGALLGIVLGRLLAEGLVGAIAQTVNTLYYETTTNSVTLEGGEIAFSLAFGLLASVIATVIPSREASLTPPAQNMKQGTQGGGLSLLRKRRLGFVLLALGIGCAFLRPVDLPSGTTVPWGGYLAAVILVFSSSILIGSLFRPVAGLLGCLGGNAMRKYAASQLARPEGRHRLTAAGLAVAIGMSAAMAILVASFENTLTSWIHQLLKADIYISAAGSQSVANENTISQKTWQEIEDLPGVAGLDKLRRYTITKGDAEFSLGGADYNDDPERYLQLIWLKPPDETGSKALETKVDDHFPGWASESLARRFALSVGDDFELPSPDGPKSIRVEGVFAEYGNETGTLIVSRQFTRLWFADESISNIALYLEQPSEQEAVLQTIQENHPTLTARTNEKLRSESIRIFHQTFAVTYALEAIAVIIAVAGLGLALAGLLLERRNELATLKSLGATRSEIANAAMWEGIGIAVAGLVGGYLLSLFLGWILIFVINPQSFGWTLSYRVPWGSFLILAVVTVGTAAIVARLVGYRNAELQSEREE